MVILSIESKLKPKRIKFYQRSAMYLNFHVNRILAHRSQSVFYFITPLYH